MTAAARCKQHAKNWIKEIMAVIVQLRMFLKMTVGKVCRHAVACAMQNLHRHADSFLQMLAGPPIIGGKSTVLDLAGCQEAKCGVCRRPGAFCAQRAQNPEVSKSWRPEESLTPNMYADQCV